MSGIRESEDYKKMDAFTAAGYAEGFVEPPSREAVIAAWQWLHDTRTAYSLQGWYGRTAQALITEGEIEP